jgi:hypothetical protein
VSRLGFRPRKYFVERLMGYPSSDLVDRPHAETMVAVAIHEHESCHVAFRVAWGF